MNAVVVVVVVVVVAPNRLIGDPWVKHIIVVFVVVVAVVLHFIRNHKNNKRGRVGIFCIVLNKKP